MKRQSATLTLVLGLFLLAYSAPLVAQCPCPEDEEPQYGWFHSSELSLAQIDGNAESSTLALRHTSERVWESALFTLEAAALRAESSTINRFAVGTPSSFQINEERTSETTAENYLLRGRYDQQINDRMFWFVGASWERNEFAGFDSRAQGVAGVGHLWFDNDAGHFRTHYGVTYTVQDDLIENPDLEDGFLGLQLGWDYGRQLSANTTYTNVLLIDANLDEGDDWRGDMINSLTTSMTDRLALKLSLQFLYDNLPALTSVAFVDAPDTTVFAPLDELDTVFTAALVVSF